MARLHEYQGKAILAANGFKIPRGRAGSTADEAVAAAEELTGSPQDESARLADKQDGEVVIKIQAWTTERLLWKISTLDGFYMKTKIQALLCLGALGS